MNETKGPKVSIIIPAYNREHTISRSIQSALMQTFQDFEIIVVDDGSTDQSEHIVESFRDSRIHYLKHERNLGEAAARNTGIKAARGEYLAFLDSDDEWLPGKLSQQIASLEDPSTSGDMSCSGFFLVIDGIEYEYSHPSSTCWVKRLHWICDLSPGTTLVIRRECCSTVGLLDEQFVRHTDWDWMLRLLRAYTLSVVEEPLARIYRGPLPPAEAVELSTHRLLSKHEAAFRVYGWYYRHRVISKHWLMLAYWFYRERKFLKGNLYLFKAFIQNPPQNGILFLLGVSIATIDALFGTSVLIWARERRRFLLGR